MDQIHFETSFFENVVNRDPIHPSRLQGDGPNLALLQPIGHCLQLGCGATEATYCLAVPCRWHRHIVGFVADVNACGIGMHDFQTEILTLDFPHHLTPLLVVHFVPVIWCWTAASFFVFRNSLGFHANLSAVNSTRLGPVGDPYTVSPSGSGRCSFQNNAAPPSTQSPVPEPCSFIGQKTRQSRNAALAAEPCCVSDSNRTRRASTHHTICSHSF